MSRTQDDSGFTIIEVLVAIVLFSVISIGFYQVMISTVRGSETTRTVANIAEESRLGFNRILRDAREADSLDAASPTSFTIWVDYNANNTRDYTSDEYLRYTFSEAAGTIVVASLDSGGAVQTSATLMSGVEKVSPTIDVFDYTSNRLEYDYTPTPDGVTVWEEIDNPPAGITGIGDRDGTLDSAELTYLSNIQIRFNVQVNDRQTEFYGEAQLRNRRFSV